MSSSSPGYLRLYRERLPSADEADQALRVELAQVFERATGRSLDPVVTIGPSLADLAEPSPAPAQEEPVEQLGRLIRQLWHELEQSRVALRRGEAELATSVPLVAPRRDGELLAERLENVLQGAAESTNCTSAAIYVLNSETTELKRRCQFNLPRSRLAAEARPLAGSVADLEALCGHAVALDDPQMLEFWRVPEKCSAALCVPISSASTIMGTMWLFDDRQRPFSDAEVSMAEIVAGRVAAELEREVLLNKSNESSKLEKQLELAGKIQERQLPQVAPMVEAWQLAGITEQLQVLGGDFHDWLVRHDDRLLVTVADCLDGGVDAALCASSVRGALRAIANDIHGPEDALARINEQLWCGSSGDQYAHLFSAWAEPDTGRLRYSAAGCQGALLVGKRSSRSLIVPSLALGVDSERLFIAEELDLERGESLVVMTNGVLDARDSRGRPLDLGQLGDWLVQHPQASAEQLVDLVRDFLETNCVGPRYDDRTILVLKRR